MERDDPYECDFCITRERVLELCRPHRERLGIARATHPGQVDALRMMARGTEEASASSAIAYVPDGSRDTRPPPARVRTTIRSATEPPAAVKRRPLTFEHGGQA